MSSFVNIININWHRDQVIDDCHYPTKPHHWNDIQHACFTPTRTRMLLVMPLYLLPKEMFKGELNRK